MKNLKYSLIVILFFYSYSFAEVKKIYSFKDLESPNVSNLEKYALSVNRDMSWICAEDCVKEGIKIESSGVNSDFCRMFPYEGCKESDFYQGGKSNIPKKISFPLAASEEFGECVNGENFIWVDPEIIGFTNFPKGVDLITVIIRKEKAQLYCHVMVYISI